MLTREHLNELEKIFPEKILTQDDEIRKHSGSLFYISQSQFEAIFYAETHEDVIKLVNFCIKKKIPLIPYGSGTSVEGHASPINGGICLNLSKMKKVIEFKPEDGYVVVQPGLSYNELNHFLDQHKYHFPVEAGSGASIGGMTSTNASGAGATDSGSMLKNVMGCQVVVCKEGKATQIRTGTKSPKSSAGYNLTHLFIGSEGTLGVLTEITLKIRKNFPCHNTICCQFDEIKDAINFVISMKGLVQFRRVELLDQLQTEACLKYSNILHLDSEKNTIIVELAGNEVAVSEESELIVCSLRKNRGVNIKIFNDKESSQQIWLMRKNACPAAINYIDKNKKAMATDVSVPLSNLRECITNCYVHMQRMGLKAPLVAHIGDGNFHFTILVDPGNRKEVEKALDFNRCVVKEALKLGGTCTGEHGIGVGKKEYLEMEHGDSLFLMRALKEAIDPFNIFNPGKIVEPRPEFLNSEKKANRSSMFCPSTFLLRSKI